jgi:hypothetical protein
MNAYLSTPKFIMCLTDLSLELIEQPDRDGFLQQELKKINRKLPAAVYLPFVNGKKECYKVNRFDEKLRHLAHCLGRGEDLHY